MTMIVIGLLTGFVGIVFLFGVSPTNKVLPETALVLALLGLSWGAMASYELGLEEGYNKAVEDAGIEMVITTDTTYTTTYVITKDTTWVKK